MTMQAGKSHDLTCCLQAREYQWCKSQFEGKRESVSVMQKAQILSFPTFQLYLRPQYIGCGPPTLRRAMYFIPPTYSNANLIKIPCETLPEVMFNQISGHPIIQLN